jgi:hypothetical protein
LRAFCRPKSATNLFDLFEDHPNSKHGEETLAAKVERGAGNEELRNVSGATPAVVEPREEVILSRWRKITEIHEITTIVLLRCSFKFANNLNIKFPLACAQVSFAAQQLQCS